MWPLARGELQMAKKQFFAIVASPTQSKVVVDGGVHDFLCLTNFKFVFLYIYIYTGIRP
jgi:hypothetical protein